jgi:hypothetical protein
MTLPRGIRNNNPGNIRLSHTPWLGQVENPNEDVFVTFDTAHNGLRAIAKILLTYETKYGLHTIGQIIDRWAPPSENDTEAYKQAVADHAGYGVDDPIGDDAGVLDGLIAGIVMHENGQQPYDGETIEAAVNQALSEQEA